MSGDFDWNEAREDLVVRSVRGIAVYLNPDGDIVIRQEAFDHHDDDPFIVVPILEVAGLIKRLQALVGESWEGNRNA